jgi:carnitine-CoA ligase
MKYNVHVLKTGTLNLERERFRTIDDANQRNRFFRILRKEVISLPEYLSALEGVILQRRDAHPNETFLKWKDEEVGWQDFVDHIYAMAAGFWDAGMRTGDRAAIMMGNCPEFLYTYYALVFMGVGVVPVNVAQRGDALAYILNDSGAAVIIIDEGLIEYFASIRDRVPSVRLVVVHGSTPFTESEGVLIEEWLKAGHGRPPINPHGTSPMDNILYTSGTTGPPKGVVNRGINPTNIVKLWEPTGVQPGETVYTSLPLFHGNALGVTVLGAIILDFKLALGERFSASRHWDECRKYNAVEFNTLGAMIPILLKQPERATDADNPVRVVLTAGCPAHAWRPFEERFKLRLIEWFGMVDSPGFLINITGKVGAMGKPMPGFEFQVVDDNDHELSPGKVGELVFRSPAGRAVAFYYGKEEATTTAWHNDWFHSGDLAWVDEEGDFFYAGRKKASMRRRGENISAWEIESVVNQHPKVLESAAHAVPSELGEDEIKLAIVLKPDHATTPEEILDFCHGKMAYYAIPRYVEFRESLPKTGTHRNDYSALKKEAFTSSTWDREAAGYAISRDQ